MQALHNLGLFVLQVVIYFSQTNIYIYIYIYIYIVLSKMVIYFLTDPLVHAGAQSYL